MAWVKVPPEHHPIFRAALPRDTRVETQLMFGGVAAKVNGHLFAGLFGRSVMLQLAEPDRTAALALEGAGPFDPMGDGRARSDKVMLPEAMMDDPDELRAWIGKAFTAAARLPPKAAKKVSKKVSKKAGKTATKQTRKTTTKRITKKAAAKTPAPPAKSKRARNKR